MNRIFLLTAGCVALAALTACNPEPDEGDLFTAKGVTALDFIRGKSELTSFLYILERIGLDRNLSTYGEYTCLAPDNDAVALYIDSLYNDTEARTPRNGMTENSLRGLSDSLCADIARYHITGGTHTTVELGGGGVTIPTLMGRTITTEGFSDGAGRVTVEREAVITEADGMVTNGVVHILNHVIPKSSRIIIDEMERHGEYSIFAQALRLTGLADSMSMYRKDREYSITDTKDTNGDVLYHPEECKVAYTVFAEPDEVMAQNGINSIDDLIAFANEAYGAAADWYDWLNETGHTVSTGTDYTSRYNALNMFVAYHLLYAGMTVSELVFENSQRWYNNWNYVNGAEPFDYYETMLPHTLLKIWLPNPGRELCINRFQTFNTLTDEVGTMGSAAMHQVVRPGIRVARPTDGTLAYPTDIHAYNGFIHAIGSMLVYDRQVPRGVLYERLRFDATTFLPEFINNGIRMSTMSEISLMNGGKSGARVAFPLDYFDNVVSFTPNNRFRYNVKGQYNHWQADCFQGWGDYDFAVRLPPVPSGTYELRIYVSVMSHGGMMQFYLGEQPTLASMQPLDIPLDVRIDKEDPRIGWTPFYEEEDLGIATDQAMRNRGYMRGPFSFVDHPEYHNGNDTERNMRGRLSSSCLRRILGRMTLKQSEDHWLRYKSVISDETDLKWVLDFVEFVPVSVVDNDTFSEDWF